MMAQFKSCTEFTTHSGNTKVYIFRKQKEKETESEKKFLRRQKLLGMVLIAVCVIGCIFIPEDCGGYIIAGLLGLLRIIYN